jgi:hypothetical protein
MPVPLVVTPPVTNRVCVEKFPSPTCEPGQSQLTRGPKASTPRDRAAATARVDLVHATVFYTD